MSFIYNISKSALLPILQEEALEKIFQAKAK